MNFNLWPKRGGPVGRRSDRPRRQPSKSQTILQYSLAAVERRKLIISQAEEQQLFEWKYCEHLCNGTIINWLVVRWENQSVRDTQVRHQNGSSSSIVETNAAPLKSKHKFEIHVQIPVVGEIKLIFAHHSDVVQSAVKHTIVQVINGLSIKRFKVSNCFIL